MKDKLRIWTIGHSTRDMAEFLELLQVNDIEAIADVRSYPSSRRYPHFNADPLAESLREAAIDYVVFPALGGKRRPRPDSQNAVWRNSSFRGYADHMETAEFQKGVAALLQLARAKRTAIMCAEAVWWRCHRSMISDHLKAVGVTVAHILSLKGDNTVHPFTSAARVENGKLVYGAGGEIGSRDS